MPSQYSPEKKQALVREVNQYVEQGMSQTEAAKKAGISIWTYRNWAPAKRKYQKKAKPQLVTFQMPEDESHAIVLVGKASEIKEMLASLAQVGRK